MNANPIAGFKFNLEPTAGQCAKCGKTLGAYWSKVNNRNTGQLYCQGDCGYFAKAMFLSEHGMHDYSDGWKTTNAPTLWALAQEHRALAAQLEALDLDEQTIRDTLEGGA